VSGVRRTVCTAWEVAIAQSSAHCPALGIFLAVFAGEAANVDEVEVSRARNRRLLSAERADEHWRCLDYGSAQSESTIAEERLACLTNNQLKLRKELPTRLRALGLNEVWLQNEIARDTSLLGLGELELVKREKIQAAGGRIDFVMADADETRYEIEVMLGVVDESHIIRTIEYWDIER
jgi:hypothetical protein